MFLIFSTIICLNFPDFDENNQKIFYFTKTPEEFNLKQGRYFIECYGAQGGSGFSLYIKDIPQGGKGAYVSGYLDHYDEETTFYAFVGGQGSRTSGGFNGGGDGYNDGVQYGGGGGGATDIRITSNTISDRIIVAAGGSGGIINTYGEPGGDLTGYHPDPTKINYIYDFDYHYFYAQGKMIHVASHKTNQTAGGANGEGFSSLSPTGNGGGGGFFGGDFDMYGIVSTVYLRIGHSGSSYISGHSGCANHSSGVAFYNTTMSIGNNTENGKIVLTLLESCPENCANCTELVCYACESDFYLLDNKCLSSCPHGYEAVDGKCNFIGPTTPFTESNAFTESSPFTQSSLFTRSSSFSATSSFTSSSHFTKSSVFTDSSHPTELPPHTSSDSSSHHPSLPFSSSFSPSGTFDIIPDASNAKSRGLKTYAIILIVLACLLLLLIVAAVVIVRKRRTVDAKPLNQTQEADYTSDNLLFNQQSDGISSFSYENPLFHRENNDDNLFVDDN